MDWKKWFAENAALQCANWTPNYTVNVEDMYQAFKARLAAELLVDTPATTHYGILQDIVLTEYANREKNANLD